MKIRKGFVSNSSSSSFIAELRDFDSVIDIALAMVPLRDYAEKDKKLCAKLEQLKKTIPSKTPITFPSTNYDTYIYTAEMDGREVYVVDTCNNHPFFDIEEFRLVPEDFKEKMIEEEITKRQIYYDIELDLLYKEIPYNGKKVSLKMCDKHYCFIVELAEGEDKGQRVCPVCYFEKQQKKKPIEVYQRKRSVMVDFESVLDAMELQRLWGQAVELAKCMPEANEVQKVDIRESVGNIVDDIKVALIGKEGE